MAMDNTIQYLNTDLDLISPVDLSALALIFKTRGVYPLHVTHDEGHPWYATFERDSADEYSEPEEPQHHIEVMLAAIESLEEPHRSVWQGCTLREFNIGYDCGTEPWAFNQGLTAELLGRMAAVGGSLRFTLYPDTPEPGPVP